MKEEPQRLEELRRQAGGDIKEVALETNALTKVDRNSPTRFYYLLDFLARVLSKVPTEVLQEELKRRGIYTCW